MLACAVGIHRVYQSYGILPERGGSIYKYLAYEGTPSVDPWAQHTIRAGFKEMYPGVVDGALPYARNAYADLSGTSGYVLARFQPGWGEDNEATLAAWLRPAMASIAPAYIAEFRSRLYAHPMLPARIGKPVFRAGTVALAAQGDETQARTRDMIDAAIANEGTISTHAAKPVWVGVSWRISSMRDVEDMAAVDMFKRAGFTNVNYFHRHVPSTTERDQYVPSPNFLYNDIPSNPGNDCWMYFGHGLHNQEYGNSVPDSSGISGQQLDALFNWQSGALTFGGTSFPVHHVIRCQAAATGVGGVACQFEPGYRADPHSTLFALLNGQSVVEAVCYVSEIGGPAVVCGDPLYRPFKDETNPGNIEWWPRSGATPGVPVYIEADPPAHPPAHPPPKVIWTELAESPLVCTSDTELLVRSNEEWRRVTWDTVRLAM
jgi:hypothetical protein